MKVSSLITKRETNTKSSLNSLVKIFAGITNENQILNLEIN